jgi:DNA polymerase-1
MGQNLAGIETKLVTSVDEAHEFMRWLGERRTTPIAFDTETTGLSPYEPGAALRLCQFGDGMTGWAIPFQRWGGVVMEALNKLDGDLIFHNIAFEARWMKAHAGYHIPWHRAHDTMIGAHLVDPTASVALKSLSARYIDRRAVAGQRLLDEAMHANKWTWATVPIEYEGYWAYGALDTILTARLWENLNAHNLYPDAYQLEMATRRVASAMEDAGTRIDLDYCSAKFAELNSYAESVAKWGHSELGVKLGSGPQLVRWFEDNGAEITEFTAKGAPSVNKYQLRLFANGENCSAKVQSVAKIVLDMRRAQKLATTYFENFLKDHEDGLLHPEIRTLRARTGRMSITKPALQTLPRGEAVVRNAFVPDEGHVLVSSDWSQIEMRLMAHFSQDPQLQDAFRVADQTGGDFFAEMGKIIFSDPNFNKKDPRRALVKGTMYGASYGAGTQKMAETAGVSFDQMKIVADSVFGAFPGIRRFQSTLDDLGARREKEEGRGYVVTPIGRKLPADEGRAYTLVNYLLQSTAADCLKKTMVSLDNAGLLPYMKLPVHDELIFSIPREDVQDVMREIGEIMTITDEFAVQIPAEPEGPLTRWGEKYSGKEQPYVDPHVEYYTSE